MDTSSAGRCSSAVRALRASAPRVPVAGFHPGQPRADAGEATTKLIRRVASRAAVARSVNYEIGPWTQSSWPARSGGTPDLPLALVYPGGEAELDEAWNHIYAPRPWIP